MYTYPLHQSVKLPNGNLATHVLLPCDGLQRLKITMDLYREGSTTFRFNIPFHHIDETCTVQALLQPLHQSIPSTSPEATSLHQHYPILRQLEDMLPDLSLVWDTVFAAYTVLLRLYSLRVNTVSTNVTIRTVPEILLSLRRVCFILSFSTSYIKSEFYFLIINVFISFYFTLHTNPMLGQEASLLCFRLPTLILHLFSLF